MDPTATQTAIGFFDKLDATQLILVLCLFGGWKLIRDFLAALKNSGDQLNSTVMTISKDIATLTAESKGLREDLVELAQDVRRQDDRLHRLEKH